MERVTVIYRQALTQLLTQRKSALTSSMFHDLFRRFPVSVAGCVVCCLLVLTKYGCNSGGIRERNFSTLLQAFKTALRFPRFFSCSDS